MPKIKSNSGAAKRFKKKNRLSVNVIYDIRLLLRQLMLS